ncbi:Uncharacterised protein [Salmonella enterica subsp. enterica serovar Bovismorbificans]|uniref:Uncharacterized protein n=1 Tax=Salmonella enterica subsp. enterica serovar Bovismorbificans TaxID=58097 RepID=A0A655BLS1_SALET|nr:Uncharacterised protein [Salmonella enterica subsp. enterica serovar Bovismorbificans]
MANPRVQGVTNQFAGAETGCPQRITRLRRHQHQSARRRHFNNRRFAVAGQAIKSVYFFPHRPANVHRNPFPAGRSHHRVHGSFSAIGDR